MIRLLALLTLLAALGTEAVAVPIIMTRGTISSAARDGVNPLEQEFSFANLLPSYEEVTATAGATVTTTIRDWQVAPDDTTTLGFAFDHVRNGTFGSYTDAVGSRFSFIMRENAWFSLEGFFALYGGERILFDAELLNVTTGDVLFSNTQDSENTRDQRFVLGQQDGDLANALNGSLSGALLVGHEYALSYRALLNTRVEDAGATGEGGVWLTVRTTPVSAPSTLLLVLLGAVCIARRVR